MALPEGLIAYVWVAACAVVAPSVLGLGLVRTLGLYPDTTRINVIYNSRGVWSVLAVWLVGHWWGNTERHAGRAVLAWRLAGAALLLAAIVVAVTHPIASAAAGQGPG